MRQRDYSHNAWHFVDMRVNPDGTFDLLFCERYGEVPTPLWTKDGEPCLPFERNYMHPLPMLERSGIKDLDTALKHGKIYDIYFGSRQRAEEPDYGDLVEYLENKSPEAWKVFRDEAKGIRRQVEQTKVAPEKIRKEKEEEFRLESERVYAPVKAKSPKKKAPEKKADKAPSKKFAPKRSGMSIF